MTFYDQRITLISKEYLKQIFKKVSEQKLAVGLCGGWAVHFLLEKKGKKHLESRDIDLFFNPEKTPFKKIRQIVESAGFVHHSSFRWCKYLDTDTLRELTAEEAKTHPLENMTIYFVDLLQTRKVEEQLFTEPLLEKAFREKEEYELDNIRILIPTARVMIEVKTKSTLQRESKDKRQKDIADLYQLIQSTEVAWEHDKQGARTTLNLPAPLKTEFNQNLDNFIEDGSIITASTVSGATTELTIETLRKAYQTR